MITLPANPKILVVRLDRIGDMVLSTPLIRNIKEQLPGSQISLMVQPKVFDVVKHNPDLEEVIVYDKYKSQKSWLQTLKLALRLRKNKYDAAIITFSNTRAFFLAFMAGIPCRIGFREKQHFLLTHAVPNTIPLGHKVEQNFLFLDVLGLPGRKRKTVVETGEEEVALITKILKKEGWNEQKPIIVINPSASSPQRVWKKENYIQLIPQLQKKFPEALIVLTGGPAWADCCREINERLDTPVVTVSAISIGEEIALLEMADLFISNNTGPMHIAAALGTPMVALFGFIKKAESHEVWGPVGEHCETVVKSNCDDNDEVADINNITVEDVLAAAQKVTAGYEGAIC